MVKEDEMSKAYSKHRREEECKQGVGATHIALADQYDPTGIGAAMVCADRLALDSTWVATTRILVGRPEGKTTTKTYRRENNIKMNLREIG
jgi:uncharacterized protein YlxP (DUF503 family)